MGNKVYLFKNREDATGCMEERLATVKGLEFHLLKREPKEKPQVKEIRMILETDEKIIAVKMPTEVFDSFEIEVKKFYDRYARFWET